MRPDLVVAGINMGPNMGDDITYSGTVSVAMEGTLLGVPSIALSVNAKKDFNFKPAADFAKRLAKFVLENGLHKDTLLNVNIPNVDGDDLVDGVDDCPEEVGPASNHGCPVAGPGPNNNDSDSDGVTNDQDQCPNQSGVASNQGCPVSNTDPDPDQNNDENDSSACSFKGSTNAYSFGGTGSRVLCGNATGCSLSSFVVDNKGHYFMALLSLGVFMLLGLKRLKTQKDSNK